MPLYQKALGPTYTITSPFAKGWLLLLFAIIFGSVGLGMQWNTVIFLPGSLSATGTIIHCDMKTTLSQGHPGTEPVPVVSFQTQTGQHMVFEASESDSSCFEGDTRNVRYHPNDPQGARLDSNTWLVFVGISSAFGLWSLFCFMQGIIRKMRRSKTDEE